MGLQTLRCCCLSGDLSRAFQASRHTPESTNPIITYQLCGGWTDAPYSRGVFLPQSLGNSWNRHQRLPRAVLRDKFKEAANAGTSIDENKQNASSSSSSNASKGLNALDAYFEKLKGSDASDKVLKCDNTISSVKGAVSTAVEARKTTGLDVRTQTERRKIGPYSENLAGEESMNSGEFDAAKAKNELEKSRKEVDRDVSDGQNSQILKDIPASLQMTDYLPEGEEGVDSDGSLAYKSESCMVYVVAAINIAVYLFGLASPIDNPGMGSCTLPLLYGAKVNELIVDGQWWRLITPMFLHSGFLHVALSTWALLFYGPQVENVYGSLAFCMIYFLGGICGNIFSFFNTPDPTVGGTGPFFALISSWIIYLWINRKVLGESSAFYGVKMSALLGVLVVCLGALLPIDEWIHLGAIIPGATFGALACPTIRVPMDANNMPPKNTSTMEGLYARYESPPPLLVAAAFLLFSAVCFGGVYLLSPAISTSEMLENVSF